MTRKCRVRSVYPAACQEAGIDSPKFGPEFPDRLTTGSLDKFVQVASATRGFTPESQIKCRLGRDNCLLKANNHPFMRFLRETLENETQHAGWNYLILLGFAALYPTCLTVFPLLGFVSLGPRVR